MQVETHRHACEVRAFYTRLRRKQENFSPIGKNFCYSASRTLHPCRREESGGGLKLKKSVLS
jgi:hypothetical protein